MVKSTVRFPESVIEQVEEVVETETFSSKSEFHRFAVEYVLSEITDHDVQMLDFDEIRQEVLAQTPEIPDAETPSDSDSRFLESATRVRQFAMRGEIATAEEFIDTRYRSTDPRGMFLDEFLTLYRPHGPSRFQQTTDSSGKK
jgi:Arc/MetJ-type ribon-helix-helix transcriptional regulator